MNGQLFTSLLNPGIGTMLALAFFALWLHHRQRIYLLTAAMTYLACTCGFLIQDVFPPMPYELHRLISNLLFLLTACFLVITVLGRYGIAVPYKVLVCWTLVGIAGHGWFLFVQHNISARIIIIGVALCGIVAIIPFKLWRSAQLGSLLDKLLLWLSVVAAINFVVRPIVIVMIVGGFHTYDGFQQSLYWATVQFTQAMVAVSYALLMLVAVASDLIDELKQQAALDQLSGLLNRRGFEDEASAALAACQGEKALVGLLVVDLDHFKKINDSFGHAAGDAVIRIFGELVRQTMPEGTIAGRIGGEEFALLLIDTDSRSLRNYAEVIRIGIKSMSAGKLHKGIDPSLSIGMDIATPEATLQDMMRRADAALYESKRTGRNRATMAPSELRPLVSAAGNSVALGKAS